MSVSLELTREYGYVLATATASFVVAQWHASRVTPFRKAAGIPYPMPYALGPSTPQEKSSVTPAKVKAEYLFNCAQRAHANFLENYSIFLPSLLLGGLKYPLLSSALGAAWLVNRIIYAVGYTRADKEKGRGRAMGLGFYFAQIGLTVVVGKIAYDMLMA